MPQPQGYILTKGAKPQWQNPPQRPQTGMYYDTATFTKKNWAHPEDAVVFCFQRICFDEVPFWNGQWHVRGLDPARNAILLGEGGHQQLLFHYMQAYRPGIYPNMPFYVENVFEELDSPGEWYLDVRMGKLYYMPAPSVDLKNAVVEPARRAGSAVPWHAGQAGSSHHVARRLDRPGCPDLFRASIHRPAWATIRSIAAGRCFWKTRKTSP